MDTERDRKEEKLKFLVSFNLEYVSLNLNLEL